MIRGHGVPAALVLLAALLALTRCGGESTGPAGPRPSAMAAVSGDGQTDTAGRTLPQPLVVKVTTSAGAGVSGIAVSWAVTAGGGSLSASSVTTDAQGQAAVTWTLGTVAGAGNNRVTATVAGLAGSPVTFTASARADRPAQLAAVSGDNQTGTVGRQLAQPLVVAVRDRYGNPDSGVVVSWTVVSGGGALSALSTPTNAQGQASVTWTLGSAAGTTNNVAQASVAGLTGSPVTFSVIAQPDAPSTIAIVSGDAQTATVAQSLASPLVVLVRDRYGNPVPAATVSWTAAAGSGSPSAPSSATDGQGHASTAWTLGTAAGTQTMTAQIGGPSGARVAFTATALPGPAARLVASGGDAQTGPAGTTLPVRYAVKATDAYGNGVRGVAVAWAVQTGGGTISPAAATTDSTGTSTATRTLGPFAGTQTATASATGLAGSPVTFTATATPNATIAGKVTLTNALLAPPRAKTAAAGVPLVRAPGNKAAPAARTLTSRARLSARPAARPQYAPGELVVTFRPQPLGAPPIGSPGLAARATAAAVAGAIRTRIAPHLAPGRAELRGVSPAILAARVVVADSAELDAVAAELRADPAVARVERNAFVYLDGDRPAARGAGAVSPSDPLLPWQAWHYYMIDLPEAWGITTGSGAVLVAVVDNGIRFDHPAIAANLTGDGYDFVSDQPVPLCSGGFVGNAGDGGGPDPDPTIPADYTFDPSFGCAFGPNATGGHGLHVAGTIGAVGNDGLGVTGVNWTVRIRPVRVLGVAGVGSEYDVAQGILYAAGLPADNGAGGTVQPSSGARIVNLSLGGPDSGSFQHNAVIAATNAGALVVAAAGNSATSAPSYPAAFPEVLSVSAVGPSGALAPYSNFGPTVGIAAPGGDLSLCGTCGVFSTVWDFGANAPAYEFLQGTSMAAPHVTGVAALLLARNPSLTPAALRSQLTSYAVDVGAPGPDQLYGAGIVNARNSLTQTQAPPRQPYARLYAATGASVATVAVQPDGSYAFTALPDGAYYVFAGEDENGDGQIGVPGRRWGANGGTAAPIAVTVSGAGTYGASFSVGYPIELEPNDNTGVADVLVVGGYLLGTISSPSSDVDLSRVTIPQSGVYTVETSAVDGACGFGLEEDTVLGLYDASGALLLSNDDIVAGPTLNLCSRITANLSAGTYYVAVTGYLGGRYRVQARAGG